jgi:plastocyanin
VSLLQIRRVAAAGSLALTVGLLAACGGSNGDSSSAATTAATSASSSAAAASGSDAGTGQAQTLSVSEADFSIDLASSTLSAGDYTITVKNDGHATHDLVVEQNGSDVAKSDSIAPGKSATLTVTLQPGSYVFYCSIGNHRAMGMETDVTVS